MNLNQQLKNLNNKLSWANDTNNLRDSSKIQSQINKINISIAHTRAFSFGA